MKNFTIDLHCHPAQRPYGRSFSTDQPGTNDENPKKRTSMWFYDPPKGPDRLLNRVTGLAKFSQSNFAALSYGNVNCICAALYPIERDFFRMKTGTGAFTDFMANIASSLGRPRIDYLQNITDYFKDLEAEYDFYKQLDNVEIKLKEGRKKYVLVKNFQHLESLMLSADDKIETVFVIITIEGMHVLNTGLDGVADETTVLANVDKLKNWEHRPFFVTFAHHFYNELCGHAETLVGFPQDLLTRQEHGMTYGFQDLGWKVMKRLLDNSDGKRIHVDIKHMNYRSRQEYFSWLKANHAEEYQRKEIPIIVSHGACNGKISFSNPSPTPGLEMTASRMYDAEINFYDEEIIEIARSGGIIGLQLDERRIASKQFKRSLRLELASSTRRKHSNSKMVWNNIEHIVCLLDKHDMFAWDCIAIGSDFDGLVDPINMFWTAEDMDDLMQYIERHAHNFLSNTEVPLKNAFNKITALEVVDRIFHYNAYEFFRKYFR